MQALLMDGGIPSVIWWFEADARQPVIAWVLAGRGASGRWLRV